MAIATIKKDTSGDPLWAKYRIVVLTNHERWSWKNSDLYAPMCSQPEIHMLLSLAVSNNRALKQGDYKNAFVQSDLPDNERLIVKPPHGCPFSPPNSY